MNDVNTIKLVVSIIGVLISIISIISYVKKWDLFKSIFSKNRFRYTFYRYVKYKIHPTGKYIYKMKKSTYEFKDRTHMIHNKTFVVINKTPNLRFFEDRYSWSKPNCECHPITLDKHHSILCKWNENNGCSYLIKLDKYYKKDKIFKTGVKMELEDNEKESQLYLTTAIYEKTKLLILEVKFNANLVPLGGVGKILIYKDYSVQPELIFEDELQYDNKKGRLYYKEEYPLFNHRYEINWEFNE